MSALEDFRAALAAHAPLVDLVGDRVALGAVDQGVQPPLIQYAGRVEPQRGLDNSLHATLTNIEAQCWALGGDVAGQVADEVEAALLLVDVVCTSRTTTYDPELGLDGVVMAIEWWDV